MTIRLATQPDTMADRVLRVFRKERAYIVPVETERSLGPHASVCSRKESFWSCLLRSKNAPLPQGRMTRQQMEEFISKEGCQ